MKNYCLLLILSFLPFVSANGVKAYHSSTTVKQSDGTEIVVTLHGDEFFHYYTASDGTILTLEGKDLYVAGQDPEGKICSSGVLAHEPAKRSFAEVLAVTRQDRESILSKGAADISKGRLTVRGFGDTPALFPSSGSPKALVILVEFSDLKFRIDEPREQFEQFLNGSGKNQEQAKYTNFGSVKEYFTDMSFGKFSPDFDIYGPYTLNESYVKYGSGKDNCSLLVSDACSTADNDIDFSQYDSDNDGYVDLVYIIHAGYGENYISNSSDYIWPQSGTVSVAKTFDGKNVRRFGTNNELYGAEKDQETIGFVQTGIGLFCHEFCHCLGLPDIYVTNNGSANYCSNVGMGYFDLMDSGEYTLNGYRPTAMTCWERWKLGWIDIEELSEPQYVTLTTLERGGKAYRITNEANPNEYYMLEQVEKSIDLWNYRLLGDGMLVYHVDYDDTKFSVSGIGYNSVNTELGHPRFFLVAADGLMVNDYYIKKKVVEYTDDAINDANEELLKRYKGQTITSDIYTKEAAGDPFPGTSEATEFTDDSMPKAFWYTEGNVGKPITSISKDAIGNVSFSFMGGTTGVDRIERDNNLPEHYFTIDGKPVGKKPSSLGKGLWVRKGYKKFTVHP